MYFFFSRTLGAKRFIIVYVLNISKPLLLCICSFLGLWFQSICYFMNELNVDKALSLCIGSSLGLWVESVFFFMYVLDVGKPLSLCICSSLGR